VPAVFGYHELFHVLVVAAACRYAAVALFVLD
jgi:predicted membrane channel-forming protein YqfA (hemolysin III family)